MLVLSRRAEQQIVFPHLGIRINVLQVKGRLVKLGIEAPRSVKVLRDELHCASDAESDRTARAMREASVELDHEQRNELNVLNLRMEALQRKIDRGQVIDAQEALDGLVGKFSSLDHELKSPYSEQVPVSQGRPIRLLIVEDSDNERELMAYLLAAHGFDVRVACDGLAALEQLQVAQLEPDFILMDMQMPLSDGLETLMQIRTDERLRHLKVFAVTGTTRNPEDEPLAHGWDGWFQKPLDVEALVSALRAEGGRCPARLAV